jgi:hypothetical protein
VFPFSSTSTPSVSTHHVSSPILIDQFVDVAHAPILLPNHDAGTGRGVRLELLEDPVSSTAALTDQVDHSCRASAPAAHVERTRMLPRGGVNRRFKTFTSGLTNAE